MCYLFIIVAIWGLSGCSGESGKNAPTEAGDNTQSSIAFADTSLEAAVRQALRRPVGALRAQDLAGLGELEARGRGIASLQGIEQLPNLTRLDLADNRIADIAALASLGKLQYLDLDNNRVRDLSPLAGLSQLEVVVLGHNQVQDLTPLLGLGRLKSAEVSGNPLSGGVENAQLAALQEKGVEVSFQVGEPSPTEEVPVGPVYTLALVSGPEGKTDIFRVKTDGSEPLNLTHNPTRYSGLAWSPDGQRLAFVADDNPFDVGSHVFTVNADGSHLVKLTERPGSYYSLAWSPDGTKLALSYRQRVYVMSGDGGSMQVLTEPQRNEWDTDGSVAWFGDGTRIAFVRSTWDADSLANGSFAISPAKSDMYVVNTDGTQLVKLVTRSAFGGNELALSPDDTKIAFSQRPGGGSEGDMDIYWIDPAGGVPVNLTNNPVAHDMQPVWSPDGRRIAFVSSVGGDTEIYLMNSDGSNPINLSRDPALPDDFPQWSPDGKVIAYVQKGETIGLRLVDVSGEEPVNLADQELVLSREAAFFRSFFAWAPR